MNCTEIGWLATRHYRRQPQLTVTVIIITMSALTMTVTMTMTMSDAWPRLKNSPSGGLFPIWAKIFSEILLNLCREFLR